MLVVATGNTNRRGFDNKRARHKNMPAAMQYKQNDCNMHTCANSTAIAAVQEITAAKERQNN